MNLEEYILSKMGAVPDGRVACRICSTKLPLFALTKDADNKWRCGHCMLDQKRAETPQFVLGWDDIRGARKVLLDSTDWTEMPGARRSMGEEKAAAWDAYREALRNITNQDCDPSEVVWPVKPE